MPKVTIEVNMKDVDSLRTTADMLNTWAGQLSDECGSMRRLTSTECAKLREVSGIPVIPELDEAENELVPEGCSVAVESHEFDADGMPWDERIHASTQTKTQDGRWKKKRGVDQKLYDSVVAEYGTPTPPTVDEAPAPTPVPEVPTPQPTADEIPMPTPIPETPAPQTTMTYIDLFNAINTNKIPADQVTGVLNQLGMKSLPQLVAAPEHIPTVAAALGLDG